jgi:uncharacterized protein YcbK (DUF882 family)
MDARQEIINKLNEALMLLNAMGSDTPVENSEFPTNFRLEEFTRNSGIDAPLPQNILNNIVTLAHQLQAIRDEVGQPIVINSGLRSTERNKAVGGAVNSRHLTGEAADIHIQGHTPAQVFEMIRAMMNAGKIIPGGLKAYKNHVHYDIRGNYVSW